MLAQTVLRLTVCAWGDQGPALVPGKAGDSLLLQQVSGDKPAMPRKSVPLTRQQIADLKQWIDDGSPWPQGLVLSGKDGKPVVDANWWSLRPLERPALPAVKKKDWVRTPIDVFVLAKLEAKGLHPAGRRPGHAPPPTDLRPTRPAADAGSGAGLRYRPRPGRLREVGGSVIGSAALRRALGPPLARRGPLRLSPVPRRSPTTRGPTGPIPATGRSCCSLRPRRPASCA